MKTICRLFVFASILFIVVALSRIAAAAAPSILTPPASQSVQLGSNVTFSVLAAGVEPLQYQWRKDSTPILDETNRTYVINSAQLTNAGFYTVAISDGVNPPLTSAPAFLTVTIYCLVPPVSEGHEIGEPARLAGIERPSIISQPVSRSVISPLPLTADDLTEMALAGKTLLMRIGGGKAPFATNGSFTIILSAEGNTYSIPASGATPASSGTWSIEEGGPIGPVLSLDHAAPDGGRAEITLLSNHGYSMNGGGLPSQNGSWLIAGGAGRPTVQFTVEAAGSPGIYQWLFNGKPIAANPAITGSDSSTLTISNVTSTNAGRYSVFVTNLAGKVTSSNAVLTVNGSSSPDLVKPMVTIVSPPASFTRVFTNTLPLNGTAKDSGGIDGVFVQVGAGEFVQVPGTTNWFTVLNLTPGTNLVRVRAFDRTGNVSPVVTRTIFYVVTGRLSLTVVGEGLVAPLNLTNQNLEIGRNYKLTATPKARHLFSNWIADGIAYTNSMLTFPMTSNLALTANFVTNPFFALKGSYLGLFSDTNQSTHEGAGSINFTLSDQGGFSGKIISKAGTLPLSGQFGLDLAARKTAGSGSNALAVALQLGADTAYFAGSVSNAQINGEVQGYRAVFSGALPATNFAGRYTTLFIVAEDNSIEFGQGFGAIDVTRPGNLILTGALPDGATLQQSVALGPQGETAWYLPLYSGKGSLFGWLTNDSSQDIDVSGELHWTRKSGAPGPRYPGGVTNTLIPLGARYVAPVAGKNATSLTNAEVVLGGGGLVNTNLLDEPIRLAIGANNKVSVKGTNTYRLTLTIQAATGLLNGSFFNPDTRQVNVIRGALLQGLEGPDAGGGFFLNTNQTGFMFFGPESIPTTNTFTP